MLHCRPGHFRPRNPVRHALHSYIQLQIFLVCVNIFKCVFETLFPHFYPLARGAGGDAAIVFLRYSWRRRRPRWRLYSRYLHNIYTVSTQYLDPGELVRECEAANCYLGLGLAPQYSRPDNRTRPEPPRPPAARTTHSSADTLVHTLQCHALAAFTV